MWRPANNRTASGNSRPAAAPIPSQADRRTTSWSRLARCGAGIAIAPSMSAVTLGPARLPPRQRAMGVRREHEAAFDQALPGDEVTVEIDHVRHLAVVVRGQERELESHRLDLAHQLVVTRHAGVDRDHAGLGLQRGDAVQASLGAAQDLQLEALNIELEIDVARAPGQGVLVEQPRQGRTLDLDLLDDLVLPIEPVGRRVAGLEHRTQFVAAHDVEPAAAGLLAKRTARERPIRVAAESLLQGAAQCRDRLDRDQRAPPAHAPAQQPGVLAEIAADIDHEVDVEQGKQLPHVPDPLGVAQTQPANEPVVQAAVDAAAQTLHQAALLGGVGHGAQLDAGTASIVYRSEERRVGKE